MSYLEGAMKSLEEKKRGLRLNKEVYFTLKDAVKESQQTVSKISIEIKALEMPSIGGFFRKVLKTTQKHEDSLKEKLLEAKVSYEEATNRYTLKKVELEKLKEGVGVLAVEIIGFIEKNPNSRDVLEKERQGLKQRVKETDLTMNISGNIIRLTEKAIELLESANDWATVGMFQKRGLVTNMIKYEKLDSVEKLIEEIEINCRVLKEKLKDINACLHVEYTEVSSETRTIEILFNSIFTNVRVKDKIASNKQQMQSLYTRLQNLSKKLQEDKKQVQERLATLEIILK